MKHKTDASREDLRGSFVVRELVFSKGRLTIKLLSLFLVSGFLIGLQFDDR